MTAIIYTDDNELKARIYKVIRSNQDRPKTIILELIKEEIPQLSVNKIAELLLALSK